MRSFSVRDSRKLRHAVTGTLALAMLSSSLSTTAIAAPAPAAPTATSAAAAPLEEATTEAKFKAAAVLGIVAREDMLVLNDKNFVLALWRKAKEGSEVKKVALLAFTGPDERACTDFINSGIYAANQIDIDNEARDALAREKARTTKRNAVAAVPGMEATDEVINLSDKDFVFRIWQRAAAGSAVKNAAAVALRPEAAPDELQKFINTDIFAAREIDRQREIAEAVEADRKAKELKASQEAKALAITAALGIVADENMKNLPDRDFVDLIWRRTDGQEVKLAARAALDSSDPAVWKAYIFTGVHQAHQRDVEQRDAKELELRLRQTKEILAAAEQDGFQPNLVAAAKEALRAPTLTGLSNFLATGQHAAAKLDLAKPKNNMVIELKGLQSTRCLQIAGEWGEPSEAEGAGTELWNCVNDAKQRWVLRERAGSKFQLENVNSNRCLAVTDGSVSNDAELIQYDCDAEAPEQLWEFLPSGDTGMFEIRNVKSGKVATTAGGGTENATLVLQYTNAHAGHQTWRLIDVNHNGNTLAMQAGVLEFKGVQSDRCLQVAGDVDGYAKENFAGVELWDCQHAIKQRWTLIDLGDRKYALKNLNSQKCLDIEGSKAANDVAFVQYDCHFDANQQWVFVAGQNGAVKLQNVQTGGVATVSESGTHSGAQIKQFADSNGDNQQFLVTTSQS